MDDLAAAASTDSDESEAEYDTQRTVAPISALPPQRESLAPRNYHGKMALSLTPENETPPTIATQ